MSLINFEFPGLDDVPEIFDYSCEKLAFLYLEQDIRMFQSCQYIVDLLDMVTDEVRVSDYMSPR